MKNYYYDDFRICELRTVVKEVIEEKGFYWTAFENTIFFLGDHYHDFGYINQCEVLNLKEINGVLYHLINEKLEGEVHMAIDRGRRYIHAQNETLSLSFEVFPPKKTMPIDTIYSTLDELKDLKPDFISVTFGAGGSENSETTLSIANRIKTVCNVESVVHLPCINLTKEEATSLLTDFRASGIENILALRGDKVEGKEPCKDFLHASDLIQFIKEFDTLEI